MKTNLMLVAFAFVGVSFLGLGCAKANAVSSETRLVKENFYGVILNGNATVFVSQGDVNSIRLEGNQENFTEVETGVKDGALVINSGQLRNVTIYVTMTDINPSEYTLGDGINLLQINGNGVINVKTTINSNVLLMKVVGDGIIRADVRTLSLGAIINGSGRIYVRGVTGDSFTKVKGSGQVVAMNLDSMRDTSANIITAGFYSKNLTQ